MYLPHIANLAIQSFPHDVFCVDVKEVRWDDAPLTYNKPITISTLSPNCGLLVGITQRNPFLSWVSTASGVEHNQTPYPLSALIRWWPNIKVSWVLLKEGVKDHHQDSWPSSISSSPQRSFTIKHAWILFHYIIAMRSWCALVHFNEINCYMTMLT